MNILVTGGAGFIGSHTCKVLAARGLQPIVYDNLSRGHRHAVRFGPLEVGDIADAARLREVIKSHRPDAVMHFAAFINVGESVEHPQRYHSNNVDGSAVLLRTVAEFESIPIVFSSSAAVYGMPERVPIDEDHPLQPMNPYGTSKMLVERMLADAKPSFPSVALRYFNAAGSDPEGQLGEEHEPETHLIPLVLRAARDHTPVSVFGSDYDTPDGTCIRDYVHVMDIAEAHVLALDYLRNGGASCALNLANTRGYSVNEVIVTAERVTGRKVPVSRVARRPGDPAALIGSSERARQLLGWKSKRSEIEVQIADAWNWTRSRKSMRGASG